MIFNPKIQSNLKNLTQIKKPEPTQKTDPARPIWRHDLIRSDPTPGTGRAWAMLNNTGLDLDPT